MARIALSKIRFLKIKRLPAWKKKNLNAVPSFSDMGLRQDVLESLKSMNIVEPTWVQLKGIPKVLKGQNVFCGAETGSGKTLTYLAPLVNVLKNEEDQHGAVGRLRCPRSLILVPSRELAYQILSVAKSMAHYIKFRAVGFVGGVKRRRICESLEQPIDLAIATPRSLLVSKQKFGLSLSDVSHFVLDEVDTLLDDSFHKDTISIIRSLNIHNSSSPSHPGAEHGCQVTMLCATWSADLEKNVHKQFPRVQWVTSSTTEQVRLQVEQIFVKVEYHLKSDKLLELLNQKNDCSCLVFCNSIPSCDWSYHHLTKHGIDCLKFHGQVSPQNRQSTLKEFRDRRSGVMVCTDAVSRGLDLPEVDLIVNFDFPNSVKDYVHRCGRTGRISSRRKGTVVSFMAHRRDIAMALTLKQRLS